jgi:hypothetical protein
LIAESSSRWANAIIAGNDDQYRLSRDAQQRHLIGLRAAITTLEKRLAQPTGDTLTGEERRARRKAKLPKGYPSQAERFQKQRRLQVLRAELGRVTADRDDRVVHVSRAGPGHPDEPKTLTGRRRCARVGRPGCRAHRDVAARGVRR